MPSSQRGQRSDCATKAGVEVTTVVEVANEVSLDKGLKVEVQTQEPIEVESRSVEAVKVIGSKEIKC